MNRPRKKDEVNTTEPGGGGDWVRMAVSPKVGGVALVLVDEATDSEEAVVTPTTLAVRTGGDGLTMSVVAPVVRAVVGAFVGAASKLVTSAILAANASSNEVPEASSSPPSVGGWGG